jgi:cleavage and polyadenylation specificity factor subunit 3
LRLCKDVQNATAVPGLESQPASTRNGIKMAAKRKVSTIAPAEEEPVDPADELMFLCLGGGNEVGRSCHIIQYKGTTVMVSKSLDIQRDIFTDRLSLQLDAGLHAGYDGLAALPFYDDFDLSTVDVLLISQ